MTLADQPWVEKYRPKTFNEISAQENTLKSLTVTDNLPHLLFYGPPGSGKTTTILAYCRSLSESMDFVLELNASDERGIDMIRTKVKYFAKTITKRPFKIIILDEADSLTKDAQSALRRIMELYSKTTRFCLICNYLSRIIDPLASRCAKFRFQALPTAAIASRLEYIVEQEAVSIQPQALDLLIRTSNGDLRQAITLLQSASRACADAITVSTICEITGTIPETVIDRLLNVLIAMDTTQIHAAIQYALAHGYSPNQIVLQMHARIVSSVDLGSIEKSKFSVLLAKTERNLADGADAQLQLLSLFCNFNS